MNPLPNHTAQQHHWNCTQNFPFTSVSWHFSRLSQQAAEHERALLLQPISVPWHSVQLTESEISQHSAEIHIDRGSQGGTQPASGFINMS